MCTSVSKTRTYGYLALSEYEFDVLRTINGIDTEKVTWGAAMAATVEFLLDLGLVAPGYYITPKGLDYIRDYRDGA